MCAFGVRSFVVTLLLAGSARAQDDVAYYRQPALRGDRLVFVAEGDLWLVSANGGVARRLTTHAAAESDPHMSPDGKTVAFTARYEGPREVYSMPIGGGRPRRHTYGAGWCTVTGWTPSGSITYATNRYSPNNNLQLVTVHPETGAESRVPLAQANEAAWSDDGKTLYFTRLPWQGSYAKRYKGGYIQHLWRYGIGGKAEAQPLTADYAGTSKNPMLWKGRLYFLSDRDGTMNIWSLRDGELVQHTHEKVFDVRSASLDAGRIAYRVGAEIKMIWLSTGQIGVVGIKLSSDFDHTRPKWIKDPMAFLTSAHVAPKGNAIVLTTRGHVFVAPAGKRGRRVHLLKKPEVRFRAARFSADGKRVILLSDASDEVELWSTAADGTGDERQLTSNGTILRMDHLPSPDGAFIAHRDKLERLFLLDTKTNKSRVVEDVGRPGMGGLAWSPDGRWLVYRAVDPDMQDHGVLRLHDARSGKTVDLTTNRYDSWSPTFGREGKWLYFLSNRHFQSLTGSPWGARQPEAYFDRQTRVYALALQPGLRSPFLADDELTPPKKQEKKEDGAKKKQDGEEKKKDPLPELVAKGIRDRLYQLPIAPGNYRQLVATKSHLQWLAMDDRHAKTKSGGRGRRDLKALKIGDLKVEVKTRLKDVSSIELSADGEKLMLRSGTSYYLVGADSASALKGDGLADAKVDLSGWQFAVQPRGEWRQMFHDAWRMHRDYFYDAGMHGVDWNAMRKRYAPLVDRVRDRADLRDLTGMLISELSALHANVRGGDHRKGADAIDVGFLGARFAWDRERGGYRIEHIYRSDPDEPARRSPLARQDLDIQAGDVLVRVNSRQVRSNVELGALLRSQVGRPVRLRFARRGRPKGIEAIVKPISSGAEWNLRYHEWEYTRRLETERLGKGRVGYLHLRNMGRGDIAQFARDFYPVFDKEGIVIDVRDNGGGNIDSWVLARLMRKRWMYWHGRTGKPEPNMQYAPRGHMIVLCDRRTMSDGEAFTEGFRRLKLGPVLGTRTWGGEIWLSSANRLSDRGVARVGMWGVYGPERKWLIEGHGVDPDHVVDNLPHEAFTGRDRQLEEAVKLLLKKIESKPVPVPAPPPFPNKSVENNRKR
ncbi:MAG: S41 family peptidase [Planctomycetota bacterium]|jgi:tricorn protease